MRRSEHEPETEEELEATSADFRRQIITLAVMTPGGGRSPIPIAIDSYLESRGWAEKKFDTKFVVDG